MQKRKWMEQRRLWNRYISKRLTGVRYYRKLLGVLLALYGSSFEYENRNARAAVTEQYALLRLVLKEIYKFNSCIHQNEDQ